MSAIGTSNPLNELDTLVPQPQEVTVGGERLLIQPLKIGQLPGFLRAISPLMQQVTSPEVNWLALLGERGEDLLAAMAIATGKPLAWVEDLPADEAIVLAAKVIEVNADFFTRTVMPRLDAALVGTARTPQATATQGQARAGST